MSDTPVSSFRQSVGRVLAYLRERADPGTLAQLRRLTPDDPACPALFRVLALEVEPVSPLPVDERARTAAERRWAAVLQAFAQAGHLLDPSADLGTELAEAGFSELRMERLLRAAEDQFADQLRAAVAFLSSKGRRVDPFGVAGLALLGGDRAEAERRRVARSFYRVLSQTTSR